MSRFLVASLTLGLIAACGPSPEQVCKNSVAADCEKMWTCDAGVKVGDDQTSCVTQLGAFCALATGQQSFDVAKAEQCVTETKAQTCAAYVAAKPAVCKQN